MAALVVDWEAALVAEQEAALVAASEAGWEAGWEAGSLADGVGASEAGVAQAEAEMVVEEVRTL
jgi:hypothetical protein